ncbi:ATP-binding protein [Aeromicrobium wangtongii]|uniref:ATP-binding protein n=1 Tax=Aeromicrobium wangtongii TaxID=2969247 RepID=UPI002016CE44|nr:BTAD domain-containing putative transcriptional regulator [Aeromicrobium wangtongii]MCL3819783.1 hypothetical protein [Aeromicrobium wangtongii]
MQVDVLGPLRVRADDRSIDVGGPRNRALLARLALAGGRPVGAATLIDDLWGVGVPDDARGALQSVVSRTRRRLPDGVLESSSAGYVLRDVVVDADEFAQLVAAGRATEALALWRGDPMSDLPDLPFVAVAADRLLELRLTAVEASLEIRARTDPTVIAELAALVTEHPYRDGLWRAYLSALVAHGRANEALTAYERLRTSLADDLGTDPSAELQALHLSILRGERGPRRTHASLPAGLTSFVGREGAISDLQDALEHHRLVTVLGPGGAGKTRLAIEAARATSDRFGAVWLTELAPVTGEDGIVRAILSAMGLLEVVVTERAQSGQRPDDRARLLDAVRDARGLLLIDNCEHLVDGVAGLAEDLLAQAPDLRVLTTSREPLRIIGEYAYQLSPLTSPRDGATPEQAMQHSAVALFVQRARAVDQSFGLDEATVPEVVEICRRLDGQPLAIELAAARLRTLTVAQVADRLGDRFRLLTGGSRTALPRHRTLRAVVEWSWDLLDDDERDLVERIAVFPGGVTVESAAAVAEAGAPVEDLLDSLADKSLLVPVRGDQPRFRMLETLREYGVERLVERGLAEHARGAHLAHFLDLAEAQAALVRGPAQVEALTALDTDHANVMAALRFAMDRGDRPAAARLVTALAWYWSIRSQHMEAARWAQVVLELPGAADPASEICVEALAVTGILGSGQLGGGPDALWRPHVERIVRLWEEHRPDHPLVQFILETMQYLDVVGPGRVVPRTTDRWTGAMVDLMRTVLMENSGNTHGSADLIASTIDAFREIGDQWGLAMALSQRATLQALEGDTAGALACWEEALPLLEQMGATEDLSFSGMQVAELRLAHLERDRVEELRPDLEAELAGAIAGGGRLPNLVARMNMARLEHAVGHDQEAARHLEQALHHVDDSAEFGSGQMVAAIRALLAVTLAASGDLAGADQALETARQVGLTTTDMPVMAVIATAAAVIAQHHGRSEHAARVLGAAEAIRGGRDRSNRDASGLADQLRPLLGADVFEALRAEGAAMTQQDAIAFALPAAVAASGP